MSDDIELLIYRGDDFDAWNRENNPRQLPVLQYQSVPPCPGEPGGYVLRCPNVNDPTHEWDRRPLAIGNEKDAIADAEGWIQRHYERHPEARPTKAP